jgi:hypothetical protein
MSAMFELTLPTETLSDEEVSDISGCSRKTDQVDWLTKNGWMFFQNRARGTEDWPLLCPSSHGRDQPVHADGTSCRWLEPRHFKSTLRRKKRCAQKPPGRNCRHE